LLKKGKTFLHRWGKRRERYWYGKEVNVRGGTIKFITTSPPRSALWEGFSYIPTE